MHTSLTAASGLLVAACVTSLAGCSGAPSFPEPGSGSLPISAAQASTLHGIAHGGQQPIVGAKIYLLAAGTTGYASSSTSLLTASSYAGYPTSQDTSGRYYVTTDNTGSFQIVDSCTKGQLVYVASIGGNPGAGTNSAANELALLGQCPAAGNFDSQLTGVFISEVSTVAAAYATAAYGTGALHIGSPNTTQGLVGIANAFANAANMFDVQNFTDLARTNTLDGIGVVPQALVHTLANILASCINSVGSGSPSCATLFTNAPAASGGTAPTSTTEAVFNMAHNPSANVAALYQLQGPSTPFSPQLKTTPSDLSLSFSFPDGALAKNPSLAIDAQGDVWTVAPNATAVTELSPLGKLLSPATGFPINGGFANARSLALDTTGNLWVLGQGTSSSLNAPMATFAELNSSGTYLQMLNNAGSSTSSVEPPAAVTNLAIDAKGAMYFAGVQTVVQSLSQSTVCCAVKYSPSTSVMIELPGKITPGKNYVALNGTSAWVTSTGNTLNETSSSNGSSIISLGGLNASTGVAFDHSGNAWIANSGNNSLSEFASSGTAVSGSTGFTGGGLATPAAIVVDGGGTIWMTNSGNGSVSELTSAGASVGNGFIGSNLVNPSALAIDPSGNIWVTDASSKSLTEYVGLGTPVVTPLATAVSTSSLGVAP